MKAERLRHIGDIRVSNVDKTSVAGQVSVRLCNYIDVYHHDRITADLDFMDATATPEQCIAFQLSPDDVLLTKDSETPDDIGVAAVVAESIPGTLCGYHLAMVRPRGGRVDGRYLRYALASGPARAQMSSFANGITRFGLRASAIGNVLIPMRPVGHQRAIADYLDREIARLDGTMQRKSRLLALQADRRAATLDRIVDPARIGVPRIRMKYLASERDERLGRETSLPMLSVSIHRGVVLRDEMSDRVARADAFDLYKRCEPGDVVINRMRAFQGGAGRAEVAGIVSPDYLVLQLDAKLDPSYAHHLIRTRWFVGEMSARIRGIGSIDQGNVRTPRINWQELGLIEVPALSLADQTRVATTASEALRSIARLEATLARQIELLSEKRQALITAAVTGQIPIPGAV